MYSSNGSVVSCGKNVGLQCAAEKPSDGPPAFHVSVASNKIGKSTGAEARHLQNDAAVIQRVYVTQSGRYF